MSIQINDKSNKTILREMDESNKKLMDGKKKQYASNLDAITRDNFNILVGIPVFGWTKTATKRECPQCNYVMIEGDKQICDCCWDLNHGIKKDFYTEGGYHDRKQKTITFKIKNYIREWIDYIERVRDYMKKYPIPGRNQ